MPLPQTSGALTTASTLRPTAPPASATATVTLVMTAAHVSEQMSYLCGLTPFCLVPDDATVKSKLTKALNKSHNKVQRRAHIKSLKTKTSFMSKRMLNIF